MRSQRMQINRQTFLVLALASAAVFLAATPANAGWFHHGYRQKIVIRGGYPWMGPVVGFGGFGGFGPGIGGGEFYLSPFGMSGSEFYLSSFGGGGAAREFAREFAREYSRLPESGRP